MQTARDNWLELRRSGIGASDIGAILGLSEFKSPLHIYMEKTMRWQSPDQSYRRLGHLMEPVIASLFEDATGLETISLPEGSLYRSKKDPLKLVTPDRLIKNDTGLEMKNVGAYRSKLWGPSQSDTIPIDAYCQVQWTMDTLDFPHWYVAALIAGNDFRHYRFERDPELCSWMSEAAHKFARDHLDTGIPPEASPDVMSTYLKARYPTNTEHLLPATDEAKYLARRRMLQQEIADDVATTIADIDNQLRALIGAHEGIDGIATWTNNKDSAVTDWQAIATALSASNELIKQHTKMKPGPRVFRFKYKGD